MKRKYEKPALYFEEYELSSSIAGNCGNKLFQDKIYAGNYMNCKVDAGGGDFLFLDSAIGCNTNPGADGDLYCYQVPSTNEMLFNS